MSNHKDKDLTETSRRKSILDRAWEDYQHYYGQPGIYNRWDAYDGKEPIETAGRLDYLADYMPEAEKTP